MELLNSSTQQISLLTGIPQRNSTLSTSHTETYPLLNGIPQRNSTQPTSHTETSPQYELSLEKTFPMGSYKTLNNITNFLTGNSYGNSTQSLCIVIFTEHFLRNNALLIHIDNIHIQGHAQFICQAFNKKQTKY